MELDVFKSDAFSMHSLTATINKLPFQPTRLAQLALFDSRGIMTTSIDVEEQSGRLTLIQSSPRGSVAADFLGEKKRTMRTFKALHFERDSKVRGDEIQNVRAFGSETELQTIEAIVADRMSELTPMHDVTLEFQRINAVQGLLIDADGTTLYNLFTEFGVTQQTQDFAFTTTTLDVRGKVTAAKRLSEAELGGTMVTGYRAFCGATFFDALVSHPNVIAAFQYQQGQVLASDLRDGFKFGDVTWEEYRGSVTKPDSVGGGSATFVNTDQAFLVPQAPIFITRFAPADYSETANTIGLPRYAKMFQDPGGLNKFQGINTQSNPISLCLRPRAVIKLTHS